MIFVGSQVLPRALGYSLLIMLAAYLLIIYRYSKNNENTEDHELTLVKSLLLILLGIVAVILGGQLVVQNSIILAKILNISDTIIGLTIVALGTSLPELTTSIIAAKKGEHGIAIGNAIGSNIINILLILGVSSIISPLSINVHNIQDAIIFASINIVIRNSAFGGVFSWSIAREERATGRRALSSDPADLESFRFCILSSWLYFPR